MKIYAFGEFTLNPAKRVLFREAAEIRLRDKDFEILHFLLDNAPKICSHDEIINSVWNGTNVENNSLEKAITNIRSALGDNVRDPRFIKTVRAKGYLFVADLRQITENGTLGSTPSYSNVQPGMVTRDNRDSSRLLEALNAKNLILLGVFCLTFLIGGLVWGKGRDVLSRLTSTVIFADDFNNNEIDPNRWTIHGRTVKAEDGKAKLLVEETDHWGRLDSAYFAFDRNKPITVSSRIKVMYSQNLKDKVFFHGYFGLQPKTSFSDIDEMRQADAHIFGVKYANYDYESKYPDGSIDEQKSEGFFLVRDGGDPSKKQDYENGKVSPRIQPVWGQWFEQKMLYEPFSGKLSCYIDGQLVQDFNVGKFSTDLREDKLKLEINPEGWWLYHSIEIDYIEVTQ